jgi:hypothetical protein
MATGSEFYAKQMAQMAAAGITLQFADPAPVQLVLRDGRNRAVGTVSYDMHADAVDVGDMQVPPMIDVELTGGPRRLAVSMKIEIRRGRPACTDLRLTARSDGPEVRAKDLRAVAVDDLVERAVARCSQSVVEASQVPTPNGVPGDESSVRAVQSANLGNAKRARTGRPRVPREHLIEVAELYANNLEIAPTKAVAEAYGVSPRTAAGWVQKCRSDEYGLLPKTVQGQRKA